MDHTRDMEAQGPLDARYIAFLETITQLRPRLHRYCSRMTGSVLDGEDVVQEALFQAYRKLDTFDDTRPLKPWLFRIAPTAPFTFPVAPGIRQRPRRKAAAEGGGSPPPSGPVGLVLG